MERKLGRKSRKFDVRIPRLLSLLPSDVPLPPLPAALDYSEGLPEDLGQFLNDSLEDCTCAAFYHARQIWSGVALNAMIIDPVVGALQLYEGACGYKPGDASTDQGGVEQDVLNYLLNTGAPVTGGVDKILGYVEITADLRTSLQRTIAECGVAYVGLRIPQSVMDNAGNPALPWNVGGNDTILGGHAVVLVGYDADGFTCISWGKRYKITHAFMVAYLDEAYGIIDHLWVEGNGKTPFGMTLDQLETAMQGLRNE
jgi:hypothetical protein